MQGGFEVIEEQTIETPETESDPTIPPAPGIYTDAIAEDYHFWNACNASRLKYMDRSAKYCRYRIRNQTKPTPAMLFGTACHFAVLEPGKFDTRYAVAGRCSADLKTTGKRCTKQGRYYVDGEWYCGTPSHAPESFDGDDGDMRYTLTQSEYDRTDLIRSAVHSHPFASSLLNAPGVVAEASMVWKDELTGLTCKGRPDLYDAERGYLVDLKFTRDAHPSRIEKFVASNSLHIQMAFYTEGLCALDVKIERQFVIAVEPEAPHEVCVYECSADMIPDGHEHVRRLRGEYAACVESCKWPGYTTQPEPIGLPYWKRRELFPEEFQGVDLSIGGEKVRMG